MAGTPQSDILRISKLLSIDIVAGSLAGTFFASRFFHVSPPVGWFILLPLSVWIIYTADHLADSYFKINTEADERYLIIAKHRNWLIGLMSAEIILWILAAIHWFDPVVFRFGLMLTIPLLGYFILNFSRAKVPFFFKEPGIASVYTVVVAGFPMYLSGNYSVTGWLFILNFFLVAFGNVIIFSFYGMKNDLTAGKVSFSTAYGEKNTQIFGSVILLLSIIDSMVIILKVPGSHPLEGAIFLMMSVILLAVLFSHRRLRKNDLYAWLADGVFLLGLLEFLK